MPITKITGFAITLLLMLWAFSNTAKAYDLSTETLLDFGSSSSWNQTGAKFGTSADVLYIGTFYQPTNTQYVCSARSWIRRQSEFDRVNERIVMTVYENGIGSPAEQVAYTTSDLLTSELTTTNRLVRFIFNNCWTAQPNKYYFFELSRTGGSETTNCVKNCIWVLNKNSDVLSNTKEYWYGYGAWTQEANKEVYINLYGLPGLGITIPFSPTASESNWSLSGADEFCDEHFPASSSWNPFNAFNLCVLSGYLFIPSSDILADSFNTLVSTSYQRVPFSYMLQFAEILKNTETASTSSNYGVSLGLDLNFMGSSGSVTFAPFSSQSLNYFGQANSLSWIRTLSEMILYLGFAFYWYEYAMKYFKPHKET